MFSLLYMLVWEQALTLTHDIDGIQKEKIVSNHYQLDRGEVYLFTRGEVYLFTKGEVYLLITQRVTNLLQEGMLVIT